MVTKPNETKIIRVTTFLPSYHFIILIIIFFNGLILKIPIINVGRIILDNIIPKGLLAQNERAMWQIRINIIENITSETLVTAKINKVIIIAFDKFLSNKTVNIIIKLKIVINIFNSGSSNNIE